MTASLSIVHADDDFVAVDKPSGLVVHPGRSGERDHVLSRMAALGFERLHPVHRLDRATSGVMVLARHPEAARAAGASFQAGRVDKSYVALVRGSLQLEPDSVLLIDHPIPADEGAPRVPARTRVASLATVVAASSPLREKRYGLVRAWPETGRFHQVRRHLKHAGHPLVGDTTYGRSEHNQYVRGLTGLDRLALHAESIAIALPDRTLSARAPLATDLARALECLGFDALSSEGAGS